MIISYSANAQDTIKKNQLSEDSTEETTNQRTGQDKEKLKSKVKYTAVDSIVVDVKDHKIYLYGNGDITYENIIIKAAYIMVDFQKNEMYASGVKDSTGKLKGIPVFTEEKETFTSDNMTYNFKTKKGLVRHIYTKESEGYLHGDKVKKMPNNVTFLNTGSYTTCDEKEPDYEIRFIKAKVIPDDKIICGPALLFIEGVPTPIGVPFGYFPITKGRSSGLIIPSYGESANRGFYLENGGYYWGINDYMDASFKGDIYTRGSWGVQTNLNYNKLYHYNGNFALDYAINIISEKGLPDYSYNKDFFLRWLFNQSDKARPNSRFTANVNAGSSKYNTFNPSSTSDYLTNTFQSGVSYTTSIADEFNLSLDMRHSQNTQTKIVDLTLPEITFTANRFYPFQNKERVGKPKWYENISINYMMDAKNELTTGDSILFKPSSLKKLNNGISHNVTASSSIKLLKYFTMTNSINYNERWYLKHIEIDTLHKAIKTDTVNGFITSRDVNFSSSVSTRLYGMFQFKNGYIRAIRHVMTPTLSFNFVPEFNQYYRQYFDPTAKKDVKYSILEDGIYGSPPGTKSGMVNFSLTNNLEMKVKSAKDTVTGFKKIVLIENFTIAESYDLTKDSMQWSPLTMSGHTRLFKNVDLKYNSLWNPYVQNSRGLINKYEWDVNKQVFSRENTEWALSINYSLSSKSKTKKESATGDQQAVTQTDKDKPKQPELPPPGQLNKPKTGSPDFSIPWNLNLYYTFSWLSPFDAASEKYKNTLVQTLAFNGNVNLTKKWKIGITSGYDFQLHNFSYTSVDIYRDLHCWEMKFNWIPIGFRKSYNFTIRVKASMLQDLKLIKKTDWRDQQY